MLGFKDEAGVKIAGRGQTAHVPQSTSHFSEVNILGTDFLFTHKIIKVEDYVNRRVNLFFDADWGIVRSLAVGMCKQ